MAEGFAGRHRFLLLTLWVSVPIAVVVGYTAGETIPVVGVASLIVVAFAVTAMAIPAPTTAAVLTAVGLAASTSIVVQFAGGPPTLHLLFPIGLVAASFYRLVAPLMAALGAVSFYHFGVALWLPEGEGALWAVTHSALLLALSLILMAGWRLDAAVEAKATPGDRYRTSFTSAPIGMAVLKPSGQFVEANDSLAAMLGYEVSTLPGRNIRAVVHGEDLPILGEAWEEIGNSADHKSVKWLRCLTTAGATLWARVSLALVPHTPDEPAIIIVQMEDVTGPRRELSRLEDLVRGKDAFVATVGDEMREPLALLIDLTADDPTMRQVNARAREVAKVVDDLVASARADTSQPDTTSVSFDVAALSRQILTALPGGASIPLDARAKMVWADPSLTGQILTGLISNALRFGGDKVRAQVFNSGPDTVVQVIDDGVEIPLAERDRVFRADLRQGQPVTRPAVVGLSLTVGRHLARNMDGDLTYRRSGDGLNIFELRLPSEDTTRSYKPRPRPRVGKTGVSV